MKKTFLLLVLVFTSLSGVVKSQDFTLASEKSIHSVVYIRCIYQKQATYYDDFFNNDFFSQFFSMDPFSFFGRGGRNNRTQTYQTSGSGVIVSNDGYIVTNNHVVADADSISVTLNDRREFSAKIIGTDANNDLAVIKIDATNLQPIEYGNSDDVKVGQWVLAVGNPFNLTSTVTAGIVSAKARNINILSSKASNQTLTSFIQTDAAMNPGNSGGALVNTSGELIGVNAAIASNTGSYTGYSFAIPVNIAKKVINDIIQYGETQRASAGISVREIDSKFQEENKLKNNNGVYVQGVVKGGSGEKADIKEGDIILQINNKNVNTASEVNEIMAQLSPNQVINFVIDRNGQTLTKTVTLSDQKVVDNLTSQQIGTESTVLGAKIRELTNTEKKDYHLYNGLIITKVGKGKLASQGLKDGFIITAINNNSNITMEDALELNNKKGQVIIEGFYPNSGTSYYMVLVL